MRPTVEEIERKYYSTVPILQLLPQIEQLYGESKPGTYDRAKAAVLKAIALVDQTEFEQSEPYFREAKEYAQKHEDHWILADAIHGEAVRLFKVQDFKSANALENESLAHAIKAGHRNREAVCYYSLGLIAGNFGSNDVGADYFGRALVIVQEEGYLRLHINVLARLADSALQWNQIAKAQEYVKNALIVAHKLGSAKEINMIKLKQVKVAVAATEFDEALALIEEIKATTHEDDVRTWSTIHGVLGHIHLARGKYKLSESEFELALRFTGKSEPHVPASIHHSFAELYIAQKKYDLALKHVEDSMPFIIKSNHYIYTKRDALKFFHLSYKGLKRYKEAHEALEEYNELISREQTDALNSRLEFHALKQEYETAQLREKEKERKAELLRIELERKDQDLVEKTKHLLKQTESLAQFRNDLKALIKRLPASDAVAQEVRERLKALPEEDLHWQDFDTQFNSLHPSFLHNLTVAFPELTPMERKVCPLLRLNLETEDIAKLLFLSDRSVENHRYRIRKKLGLTTQQSLPEFLSKY